MSLKIFGKKIGMTKLFDKDGRQVPCTVIFVPSNVVTDVKTKKRDNYSAAQVGMPGPSKNGKKPQLAALSKRGVPYCSSLIETRIEDEQAFALGAKVGVEQFADKKKVVITGTSKGKGFQGVMKKYGFAGGPASHGSGFHRHAGSTGMRSTPGRCLPGGPRASHMGDNRVTIQSSIVHIDEGKSLLFVKGSVPGSVNTKVLLKAVGKR